MIVNLTNKPIYKEDYVKIYEDDESYEYFKKWFIDKSGQQHDIVGNIFIHYKQYEIYLNNLETIEIIDGKKYLHQYKDDKNFEKILKIINYIMAKKRNEKYTFEEYFITPKAYSYFLSRKIEDVKKLSLNINFPTININENNYIEENVPMILISLPEEME